MFVTAQTTFCKLLQTYFWTYLPYFFLNGIHENVLFFNKWPLSLLCFVHNITSVPFHGESEAPSVTAIVWGGQCRVTKYIPATHLLNARRRSSKIARSLRLQLPLATYLWVLGMNALRQTDIAKVEKTAETEEKIIKQLNFQSGYLHLKKFTSH